MRFTTTLLGRLSLPLLGLVAAPSLAAQAYTVEKLGDLGMGTSLAFAVNESGQVVGQASLTPYVIHAFLWEGGIMTDLGTLPGGFDSEAHDINDSGDVVGLAVDAAANVRAVIWAGGGPGPVDLGTLGGPDARAFGINSAALVTGLAVDALLGMPRACLWSPGPAILDLGTLGGAESYGNAIDGAGSVAGRSQTAAGAYHAAWWPAPGYGPVDLDPGSLFSASEALGMNDLGWICGVGSAGTFTASGFLWSAATGLLDIGGPGGASVGLYALNDAMQAVGTAGSMGMSAWLYDGLSGAWIDLNDRIPPFSDIHLDWARDINDSGQIVGWGTLSSTGGQRGYLLTPVASGLALGNPFPGLAATANGVGVAGATAGATVHFVFGTRPGSAAVPGCSGVTVDIASPKVIGTGVADAAGKASLSAVVPGSAHGLKIYLQAVEVSTCRKSNLVVYTFP